MGHRGVKVTVRGDSRSFMIFEFLLEQLQCRGGLLGKSRKFRTNLDWIFLKTESVVETDGGIEVLRCVLPAWSVI